RVFPVDPDGGIRRILASGVVLQPGKLVAGRCGVRGRRGGGDWEEQGGQGSEEGEHSAHDGESFRRVIRQGGSPEAPGSIRGAIIRYRNTPAMLPGCFAGCVRCVETTAWPGRSLPACSSPMSGRGRRQGRYPPRSA